ncbi:MAG: proline iminopeptidase-family hydrolase [Methanofollis sp.]|uniref:proline iminopeptidase-family hydrolase n=1 Tax=Methanofollis sp. TaxID=2052835 RepID=UPI00261D27A6|nr:proline iminopeptidase-family hydrolase [Methanofollis sp.]MDD4256092.1 proline iminopeptidase-family hydrolase [Methanofollis sp.]
MDLPHEGFADVPGGRVWYHIAGAEESGTPLLVLHGGPGCTSDYLEPLAALGGRSVVFYDQLGCGDSDRPDDPSLWTLERAVDELAAVREALGLDRVHILGQSWGTMLAVEYMLTHRPDGVESLVLSAPCLSASRWAADGRRYLQALPDDHREAILRAEEAGSYDGPAYQEAMTAYYRRHVCRTDPWPDCLMRTFERLNTDIYLQMWGPSEFTITGSLGDFERAGRLHEIAVPALFTCGEFDEATPATTAYYHHMMPGSEIAVFEGAAHEHHLEATAAYLAVVREFLDRAESQTRGHNGRTR